MLKAAPRVQLVHISKLRPHDENPRTITSERFEALKRALAAEPAMLRARPLIATPAGVVVAGNMRQRAAADLVDDGDRRFLSEYPDGKVPTFVYDLDEERARLWMIRDNAPYGEWHDEALAEMLYDLEKRGSNLDLTGLAPERVTQLLDSVDGRKGPNRWPDDPAPDPPDVARAKVGRVYEVGDHRIMCGDATNPTHVAKLLAGETPRLMVTDPPYGVSYEDSDGEGMIGDTRVDWSEAFALAPSIDVAYIWHAASFGVEVGAGLQRIGFVIAQQIVWDKIAFALGRSDYQWRHETALYAARAGAEIPWYGPVERVAWYARKKGSKRPWLGDRAQTTIWSAPSPKRRLEGAEDEVDHPTQKPTLLWTRPIQNHTLRGEHVYDPFCGSGTAIIAAEMTGRRALTMELDPRFVDVALARYETYMEGTP